MQNEEWRVCPSFPHYAVSNCGRVKRILPGLQKWAKPGKLLTPDINKNGHLRVTLFDNGQRTRRFVHQLVCEAWHGAAPKDRPFTCHRNDVKSDNRPENLYWGGRKENGADSVANGRSVRGERINTAKLTEAAVLEIRYRAVNGETNLALAAEFGVPDTAISQIVRGKNWKHVGGPIIETSRRGRRSLALEAAP